MRPPDSRTTLSPAPAATLAVTSTSPAAGPHVERVTTRSCTDCGAPMVSKRAGRRSPELLETYRIHYAHGRCLRCAARQRSDRTGLPPRTIHRAAVLLDDWVELRDDGWTVANAAARLGVTYAALDQALVRAKRRGDPRGCRTPFARDMAAAGVAA